MADQFKQAQIIFKARWNCPCCWSFYPNKKQLRKKARLKLKHGLVAQLDRAIVS